ncbi:glycosyl transferase, partial [Elizabethkingia anophelis]|nr:glycosyl transferase [Elizabethkingia anophelis]
KVTPVNNELFNKSLETCNGLLTGGGFEGPAEALYLGKKLLSVPMRNQFEQQCNALAMEKMGVPVIWKTADWERKLNEWIFDSDVIKVSYPDETKNIVRNMFERYFN